MVRICWAAAISQEAPITILRGLNCAYDCEATFSAKYIILRLCGIWADYGKRGGITCALHCLP